MAVRDLWLTARTKERTAKWGVGNRYQVNWAVDGQRRSRTFRRKIDAERFEAVTMTAILSGDYVDPRSGRITVKEYADRWLAQQLQLRSGSRARYRSHLDRHLIPALGHLPIGDVRRSTVQGMVTALVSRGLAPGTVRSIARTTSILFRAAVGDQVIARSPCVEVNVPEPAESRAVALTVEQVRSLAEHLPGHYRALPLVGAACGLRPGELFGLELDPAWSLDMLGRRILVRQQLITESGGPPFLAQPKTAAGVREVPLDDGTLEVLAAHLAAHPPVELEVVDRTGRRPVTRMARLVFPSADGQPTRRPTFNRTWTRTVKRARAAGVELPSRVTPHSLRHTYVALLIAAGKHPKTIQTLVGHKSITETMDTYGHLFDDQHESTRDAIGAAFRQDERPALGVVR